MSIYDYKVKTQDGEEISMDCYKGKTLLIVNTATGCGFTPQYSELQEIYDEFHDQGLEILDFPCNQFANQAPGDDNEIEKRFIKLMTLSSFSRVSGFIGGIFGNFE